MMYTIISCREAQRIRAEKAEQWCESEERAQLARLKEKYGE